LSPVKRTRPHSPFVRPVSYRVYIVDLHRISFVYPVRYLYIREEISRSVIFHSQLLSRSSHRIRRAAITVVVELNLIKQRRKCKCKNREAEEERPRDRRRDVIPARKRGNVIHGSRTPWSYEKDEQRRRRRLQTRAERLVRYAHRNRSSTIKRSIKKEDIVSQKSPDEMLDKLSRYRISLRNKTVLLMTLDGSHELCWSSLRDVSTEASPECSSIETSYV